MKIKAILFDHDGTLVDSETIHFEIWQELLKKYNVLLPEANYKTYHSGTPTPRNAEILVEQFNLSVSPIDLAKDKNRDTNIFLETSKFPLMPFVKDTIKYFHGLDLKLGVVTGAGRYGVDSTLKGHKLEKYFDVVSTSENVVNSKPDPAVYLFALKQLGISAEEAIAIEDTENGIKSAKAAGLICCAVKNEYSTSHDFSKADAIFENMDDAKVWINREYC